LTVLSTPSRRPRFALATPVAANSGSGTRSKFQRSGETVEQDQGGQPKLPLFFGEKEKKMKTQKQNGKNWELEIDQFFDNGSGTAVVPGSQSTDVKQTGSSRRADKKARPSLARRATGPRTSAGKERSKRNAIRHGIFSDVVVLAGESRREYLSLLKGATGYASPRR